MQPPVRPMLAKPVGDRVPAADSHPAGLRYEPKWDGFRCVVFRDGDEVVLGSRNEKPLTRYFPEVVEAVRAQVPRRCVLDGEVVVPVGDRLDFETLQQRIHPADSRVRMLAETTPASFVAFDVLALADEDLRARGFDERRARLESALAHADAPVHLTPLTRDGAEAADWFTRFEGAGLDGVICKPGDLPYVENKRLMLKVKHARTADCVVGGYRLHKDGRGVGSLVLGLHDDAGRLQSIGVASSFSASRRAELLDELAPLRLADGDEHPWWWAAPDDDADGTRRPGGEPSRWNRGKDTSVELLRPELVVEIAYDAMEGARLRHVGKVVRFRPEREPASCTFEQLERPVRYDLARVLAGEGA